MRYSLTFPETKYQELICHLFSDNTTERAAYLLCSLASSATETRLLVQDVILVLQDEVESSSKIHMVIKQSSYVRAIKRGALSENCFVFVHSHPDGPNHHSPQDDREEPNLFQAAYVRIHRKDAVHASLVLSGENSVTGRMWLEDGTTVPIERIRVIGSRFRFFDRASGAEESDISAFDRQTLAFGKAVQRLLGRLHIGIVGLGGTGSAVFEQLVRLGVGKITTCDPQAFELTNINRVYGSRITDQGKLKTELSERSAAEIGLGTRIVPLTGSITELKNALALRDCDIIFGCTDDEWGRSVLNKIAVYYLIPVFDLGVAVDSHQGEIKSVTGRVTTLIAGSACLLCRERIDGAGIRADVLRATQPEEYKQLLKDGYVRGIRGTEPSVVMFTSATASIAVSELLHRLTAYMGQDRKATEVLVRFDYSRFSLNSQKPREECWCNQAENHGAGDRDPYLDQTWA